MLKKIVLASATAAIALVAVADFSETAEARSTTPLAQSKTLQLQPATPEPEKPKRRSAAPAPSAPNQQGTNKFAPAPFVDLYGEPYYPATLEGMPGHYYCMFLAGNDTVSRAVQVRVRNQGNAPAGPVRVVFEFAGGGKPVRQTMNVGTGAGGYIFEALIPASAWQNNVAPFTIRIDHPNKVAETNEHNNVIESFCAGPAG